MRKKQLRPIDLVSNEPLDAFCRGLRAVAGALYPRDADLGEVLIKETKRLEYLVDQRACIETDHPALPPDEAPAGAFVEWRARVWQEGDAVAHAIARADQILGRVQFLACFGSKPIVDATRPPRLLKESK